MRCAFVIVEIADNFGSRVGNRTENHQSQQETEFVLATFTKHAVTGLSQSFVNIISATNMFPPREELRPVMSSHFVAGYAERSQIERSLRELDLSLYKINKDRLRLAVQSSKCRLIASLLASRSHHPRSRSVNRARLDRGGIGQRRRTADARISALAGYPALPRMT